MREAGLNSGAARKGLEEVLSQAGQEMRRSWERAAEARSIACPPLRGLHSTDYLALCTCHAH